MCVMEVKHQSLVRLCRQIYTRCCPRISPAPNLQQNHRFLLRCSGRHYEMGHRRPHGRDLERLWARWCNGAGRTCSGFCCRREATQMLRTKKKSVCCTGPFTMGMRRFAGFCWQPARARQASTASDKRRCSSHPTWPLVRRSLGRGRTSRPLTTKAKLRCIWPHAQAWLTFSHGWRRGCAKSRCCCATRMAPRRHIMPGMRGCRRSSSPNAGSAAVLAGPGHRGPSVGAPGPRFVAFNGHPIHICRLRATKIWRGMRIRHPQDRLVTMKGLV
mmetsp:Transcript_118422/g.339991  ORF Transcript_118422/g.339991 Transcript_118422/m.339991 type:complete len:272 (+) Transcript_118422:659-1474(+)